MIYGGHHFIDGGLQIDGTEIGTVSQAQVQEVCKQIKESGIGDIVVCGIHSPTDSIFHQERKCKEMVLQELGSVNVVCSADSESHSLNPQSRMANQSQLGRSAYSRERMRPYSMPQSKNMPQLCLIRFSRACKQLD